MTVLLQEIAAWLWGPVTICFIFFSGVFLTIKLRGIQLRHFARAWRLLFIGRLASDHQQISHFQALSTTLSGTIGTGNIAGVATALSLGGPGAIFWMWLTAILGMSIKYSSCLLAHYYRRQGKQGKLLGGPMITLEDGLGYRKLAICFAFAALCGSFTTGIMVQSNSISSGMSYLISDDILVKGICGIVVASAFALVVIGGLKRIANFASVVVPIMSLAYCLTALLVISLHFHHIPEVFYRIIDSAFNPAAAGVGGVLAAIQYGVARALFASEAGLGTAPMAQSMVRTTDSIEAGYIAMLGPFIDTLVICTFTALVIILSGALDASTTTHFQGAALSADAFMRGLLPLGKTVAKLGPIVVETGLIFFAFTTMLTWAYYGQVSGRYLFGESFSSKLPWGMFLVIVLGSIASLTMVWALADICNVFMMVPNLIAVLLLSPQLVKMSEQSY